MEVRTGPEDFPKLGQEEMCGGVIARIESRPKDELWVWIEKKGTMQ
jgi:hypothetical protein